MIGSFVHQALPMRVVFGAGSRAAVREEVDRLALSRVLVLCSPGRSGLGEEIAEGLGDRAVGVLAQARMHVPVELARRARQLAVDVGADGCVAVGGGSAIGLGKAIALEIGLPVVAVPTTYSGSEMTPVWGLTEAGRKRTGRDERVLPRTVVYDPELTVGLPPDVSATSGINAIAHAAEALYAPDATPIVAALAVDGVRALAGALPRVVADGTDIDARTDALCGSWLCGITLATATMSLHHKLCHALGGTLDLPHAATHTVVLPYVLGYNRSAAPDAAAALSRALGGTPDPVRALWDLTGALGAPRSLRELGMAETDVDRIVDEVVAATFPNPRPVTADGLRGLLLGAWAGRPPWD